ncbi:hypothetical protein [Caulobacter sp. LARHSG274]
MGVIDDELQAFITSPVMIMVGVRAAEGGAAIARAVAARTIDDGVDVDILISRRQWPEAIGGLAVGASVTATFCRAQDYRTYQLKGIVRQIVEADAVDRSRADDYMNDIVDILQRLGVHPVQIARFLNLEDLMRLRFRPSAAFNQTPGPGAGAALAAAS